MLWFICLEYVMGFDERIIAKALPDKYKRSVNAELMTMINQTLSEPELFEVYRDNLLSYTNVMNDGKFKVTDYIYAVKYCTQKLMGKTSNDSYMITFPDRYRDMLNKGLTSKEISSVIAIYNKGKLVNKIMEQAIVPTWVLNQDLHQKAINVLADLMLNANSEKVRADSANSLLNHLKPPEVTKVELDIGLKKSDDIEQLRTITAELASQQRRLLEAGVINAKEVAEQKLIGKVIEHD